MENNYIKIANEFNIYMDAFKYYVDMQKYIANNEDKFTIQEVKKFYKDLEQTSINFNKFFKNNEFNLNLMAFING